jgi:hypothetical protein
MNTIDNLLNYVMLEIMSLTRMSSTAQIPFSSRDKRTLQSLHTAMLSDLYITEKQGNLLLQILNTPTYSDFLIQSADDYKVYLNDPQWQNKFRVLPDVKKIYHIPAGSDRINIDLLKENYTGVIAIDFTFSSTIRNDLKQFSDILWQVKSGSLYYADFTEANIVTLLDALAPYNFEVDPTLLHLYNTIKQWDKQTIHDMYDVHNLVHTRFQTLISKDLEFNNPDIIVDRRLRYQYSTTLTCQTTNVLTRQLATREKPKVWVDSNTYSLDEIIASLVELRRLPLLVVFDQSTDATTITQFTELADALDNHGIIDNIGFHFRLDNTINGKFFNDAIGKRQYNSMLTNDTAVAAVLGGKLPKFFLKEQWRPMSVLCIKNTLRHSKTAVYATSSDLIISYTPVEPIIETRNKWESN